MRLGSQRALVAVIVAEFLVGLQGIGLLLREARITLATDRKFATAIVCMLMGIALVPLTSIAERRFLELATGELLTASPVHVREDPP